MELYVLRVDYYNEWAFDCGACSLIGVYDTQEEVSLQMKTMLEKEQQDGHYIEELDKIKTDLYNWCKMNIGNNFYVDVYDNELDYDSGKNNATYVIEKKLLNDSGVFI